MTLASARGPVRLGEVIATRTSDFEAQSARLHGSPPLGELVQVTVDDALTVFGVVTFAATEGIDAAARPVPRARDGVENAEVYREHPDLEHVLRTAFRCLVVGFTGSGQVRQYLPPAPVPIHYSVVSCDDSAALAFTSELGHLRILLEAAEPAPDEAVAAHVRYLTEVVARASGDPTEAYRFAVAAGQKLANLLRADITRLRPILERIQPGPAYAPAALSSNGMGRSRP